ncbi:hypothetical protein J3459_007505 [Metarhizium acridum]|nr:hypothetical protein J3459_007505 [Metarhizium acridum]
MNSLHATQRILLTSAPFVPCSSSAAARSIHPRRLPHPRHFTAPPRRPRRAPSTSTANFTPPTSSSCNPRALLSRQLRNMAGPAAPTELRFKNPAVLFVTSLPDLVLDARARVTSAAPGHDTPRTDEPQGLRSPGKVPQCHLRVRQHCGHHHQAAHLRQRRQHPRPRNNPDGRQARPYRPRARLPPPLGAARQDQVLHAHPPLAAALPPGSRVALVGIESHICITQTALDLRDAGHFPYVIADAVSSCNRTEVIIALDRLRAEHGVTVTSSESWMYECTGDASNPAFKTLITVVKGALADTQKVLESLPPTSKI